MLDLLKQSSTVVNYIFPTVYIYPTSIWNGWRKAHNYVNSPTAIYPSPFSEDALASNFNEKNRSNQKFHKLSLHPRLPMYLHLYPHTFFHPVTINELYMVLSKINLSICVSYPIPSHLLNGISPAILPYLFCLIGSLHFRALPSAYQ